MLAWFKSFDLRKDFRDNLYRFRAVWIKYSDSESFPGKSDLSSVLFDYRKIHINYILADKIVFLWTNIQKFCCTFYDKFGTR